MADSIIIGAGLVGMFTARELALGGHKVVLYERNISGQESSWAGGGILSPLFPWRYPDAVSRLVSWSQIHYPTIVSELLGATGIDPEWQRNGMLILDQAEQGPAEMWAQRYGCDIHCLTRDELRSYEPALAPNFEHAIWLPDVAQVRNPRLVKALRAYLVSLGVEIREGVDVKKLRIHKSKILGVETQLGSVDCSQVVIASGAWAGQLIKTLATEIKVEPVRGQMLMIKAEPGLVKHIVLGKEHYLIPRRDGRVLIGSTLEYVGYDKTPTPEAHEHLVASAQELVPSLAQYPVEFHWTGLRPGTHNQGVPFIGQVGAIKGLYINAGHFRNGVVLAPASARLLADIMFQRDPIVSPSAYIAAQEIPLSI